jgi:hypothetical protein
MDTTGDPVCCLLFGLLLLFCTTKQKQQTEQQASSATLKRSMSERERDSEVIEVDNDITAPGASKQTKRTVTDRLIKEPSHEHFVSVWNEAVLGKGLTFDFFSDPLVRKALLVTAQCADSIITSSSTHAKDTVLFRRTTRTAKILPATDDRLQQEAMRVLTPLYKEIGACFMGDGWQITSNRPILNLLFGERQSVRKSMICMMKISMTNPKEPSHSEIWKGRSRAG